MAEALLAGLRMLVMTKDLNELFPKLFTVMREPLDFEAAQVLWVEDDETLTPVAQSDPIFNDAAWQIHNLFRRAIKGNPVALFDTEKVDEWRCLPERVRQATPSALVFPIHTTERKALFICTHSERAHFTRAHVRLAHRFSILASQALQQLASAANLADLKERLDAEAKMAALNMRLAESEKKLAKARKMEALGLLAGGVAHDLNNILSGIVSYPELLLLDDDLSDEYRMVLRTMQEAGHRAVAVVADLLTVARGVASPRKVFDLNRIVENHLRSPEHLQLLSIYPELTVTRNFDPGLLKIRASEIHVQKVLMNLFSNAVEAIRHLTDGRILLATHNRYIDRPLKGYDDVHVGEYAVLTVEDNGGGISNEDLERIFEPFYTRKAMGRSGTGLGLTIVWNTIQDHNGYVDVTTSSKGTTFDLYFPICRDSETDPQEKIPMEALRGGGQFILVVDDQKDQRRIACAFLSRLGYRAAAVSSGEEAVDYVKAHPVDLLLLDMIMDPGINGRETYERIIKIHPEQRAVIASGYSLTEDVKAAQGLGAGSYIKKPYTLETLGRAIKMELERK